ncbi:DNA-binding HxlR family transcriptional regulator [Microbacteriaceae bacterium SG_E_30_P1]|uniref:DNA-binding HxlR family transcriptional regulator n=1 Tax=Antiquaquibacter oligotrophicus TaxID=2880260 RepID=A0ABT6KQG1_9MICO|nr:helix-turn-helix domain-containing protein [Antiquaquibacter oligotrophicus]MDH6182221.1 DNA-binding HxlR family transcriptional regulator [Antiquaquibacter oligotrophicus]UDF12119.1 helix-turn-helix transcriptional regulator [Antiquaquibacter oligotrophicus]
MDAAEFNAHCSIARSLEVVGEKWTLLILREAFRGRTRFSEFREALGVARDILSARLAVLVEHGVLSKRAYRDENAREREEYVLTDAGRDLRPVLAALTEWGDAHRGLPQGPTARFIETATGQPVRLAFVAEDGREVAVAEVTSEFTAAATI